MGAKRTVQGRMLVPTAPGMNYDGAWKSWISRDAIKPLDMKGLLPGLLFYYSVMAAHSCDAWFLPVSFAPSVFVCFIFTEVCNSP